MFAAAVAGAKVAPRAAPQLLVGLLIGAIVPVRYALASRVWPGALAENEVSNRLGQPFDYWNAVGCVAAMAVPIALWLGSRRTGPAIARVLAYPAMGACVVAILLTQSRGAAAAAAVGAIAWFALVPLRLRSLPVLVLPLVAGSAVGAWALSKDPFTKSLQPLSAKEAVAGDFGALVLLLVVLLVLVGAAVEVVVERRDAVGAAAPARRESRPWPWRASCRSGRSRRWRSASAESATASTSSRARRRSPPRRAAGGCSRRPRRAGKYWREAFRVFDDRPLEGVGAGAFEKARLRHRTDQSVTQHAHGWIPRRWPTSA